MKKANYRIERIFAHAAALQQSGRLRNTIYGLKKSVYILNQDFTVLLRFPLRKSENPFDSPISFAANDYDSDIFEERDGKICFIQEHGDFMREKSCRIPGQSAASVQKTFKNFAASVEAKNKVTLNADFVKCLDESLSHVEFSVRKGRLKIKQRNIYDGSVITITKKKKTGLGITSDAQLKSFKPIGIRTNDLLALFAFAQSVSFYFFGKGITWLESEDRKMPFVGIISQCIYDELGVT